jgi:hypothetical protein
MKEIFTTTVLLIILVVCIVLALISLLIPSPFGEIGGVMFSAMAGGVIVIEIIRLINKIVKWMRTRKQGKTVK